LISCEKTSSQNERRNKRDVATESKRKEKLEERKVDEVIVAVGQKTLQPVKDKLKRVLFGLKVIQSLKTARGTIK